MFRRRFRRRFRRGFGRRSGSFGVEPGQVQQGSGEGSGEGSRKPWCKAKSSSMVSGEGYGEGREGFGAEPGEVQQGFGEGSGEGLGGFGEEPSQVQQGSGEGVPGLVRFNREVPEKGEVCGEGSRTLWRRARSGSTGIRRRFRRRSGRLWCRARSREALVQSQVKFNAFRRRLKYFLGIQLLQRRYIYITRMALYDSM